jgi:hypothetical protein
VAPAGPEPCIDASSGSVGDRFDLDLDVDHKPGLDRGAGRRLGREEGGIGLVEAAEIARVGDDDEGLDHLVHCAAGERQGSLDVLERLLRLRLDAAGNDRTGGIDRHLAGDIDEIARAHGR